MTEAWPLIEPATTWILFQMCCEAEPSKASNIQGARRKHFMVAGFDPCRHRKLDWRSQE